MNAKNLVGFVVLCVASLFCLCNRAVGQQIGDYKKFWVAEQLSAQMNNHGDMFFMGPGKVKVSLLIPRGSKNWASPDLVTLISGDAKFNIECGRIDESPKGNLDLVREPNFYKDGFSMQDGVVTLKTDAECLHINPCGVTLHKATYRELGLVDLIGKTRKASNTGAEITYSETTTMVFRRFVCQYRFWKDGKEVKPQPDGANRFGTDGTYGDEGTAPSYRDATVTVKEGQPFLAGGLKLVFKWTNVPKQRFVVEAAEGSTMSVSSVEGKSFSQVVNPTDGYSYSPLPPEGFLAGTGDVKLIKVEGKTTKCLAVNPLFFDNKVLSCRLRFWSDQAVQLLARKPETSLK